MLHGTESREKFLATYVPTITKKQCLWGPTLIFDLSLFAALQCLGECVRTFRARPSHLLPFFASFFAISSASSSCSSLSILAPLLGSLPCAFAGAVGSSSPSLCSSVFSFFVLVEPSSCFSFFSSLASLFAMLRSSLESFGTCELGFPSS